MSHTLLCGITSHKAADCVTFIVTIVYKTIEDRFTKHLFCQYSGMVCKKKQCLTLSLRPDNSIPPYDINRLKADLVN